MNDSKFSIRLKSESIQKLRERYHSKEVSKNVRCCVQDCILRHTLYTKDKRKITPAMTLDLVKKQKNFDRRISLRLPKQAVSFLQDYYQTTSFSEIIRCCIHDVLNDVCINTTLNGHDKIFYMVGQKNVGMQDFLNESFDDICSVYRVDGYAEPFCGTANVLLHTAETDAEFLNDNSVDLVNLLRVIQKYPYELRLNLLTTALNENTFNTFKTLLAEPFVLKVQKNKQIKRATAFYFVRYASVYGKGDYFKSKTSIDGYHRRLDTIYPLSQRLQGVDIKKRDALYFAKTLSEDAENMLVYFDAPYIGSEEHYKSNNRKQMVFSAHTALRNRVEKLRQKNICLLSYRITASDSMRNNGIKDCKLRDRLDKLYLNQGFYYRLKKFDNKKGQIEILISTVPFCGAKPYITPMREVEV